MFLLMAVTVVYAPLVLPRVLTGAAVDAWAGASVGFRCESDATTTRVARRILFDMSGGVR